ncbi:MAG: hypothetical protein GW913_08845 [Myxococcales bacterium]|nr:hypothetical protein [Myxococcales bacterium]
MGRRALILGALLVVAIVAAVTLFTGQPGAQPPRGVVARATTSVTVGQPLRIQWNGGWYDGSITGVLPTGELGVHYSGWDDSYDQVVPRTRVRVMAGGTATVEPRGDVATAGTTSSTSRSSSRVRRSASSTTRCRSTPGITSDSRESEARVADGQPNASNVRMALWARCASAGARVLPE